MKKVIKVKRHIKRDGSVVETYSRTIETKQEKTLSSAIKKKRLEREQASILDLFRGEE
jgi:hypothetical protein